MDEEIKKKLLTEMKRIFQDGYNDLIEEIERLKRELDPGDNLHKRQFVLSRGQVTIVLQALQAFKGFLEDHIDYEDLDSPGYHELDGQYETTKELIGIVEEVLYGRGTLIFKRSA